MKLALWIAGGITTVVVLALGYLAYLGWDDATAAVEAEDTAAVYANQGPPLCESIILPKLKSPGSASFTWQEPRLDTDIVPGRDTYQVDGYVDSQNGFGALLRTDLRCTLWMEDEGVLTGSASIVR